MTFYPVKLTGALICFSMSIGAFAYQTEGSQSTASSTKNTWLVQQINKHPDIVSAKETMKALSSQALGSKKALYNPELETGYEREGDDNNFVVGLNQTIDWWDKREVKEQQANFNLLQANKSLNYLKQEKLAQALQALIAYKAAKKQAAIAFEQEEQLGILLDLVTKRQQAGDLGQVDTELTFLSLSQMLNNTAQAQVALKQTVAKVKELLPDWYEQRNVLPSKGIIISNDQPSSMLQQQWLEQHPLVQRSKAQWQVTKSSAQLALLDTKAEPTFGVQAGKNGDDTLLGLSFSMPLNIRNNFSEQAQAANQFANAAEADYRATLRKQKYAITASSDTLTTYKRSYQRWSTLMKGRDKRSGDLLQKQWQSGDMSTTEYLLALQQRAQGLNAGIELKSQYQLSQIDWLLQIGQINKAIEQLSQ